MISYAGFNLEDSQLSYLLVGGNLGLDAKKNNFFFFVYILKNMLSIESSIKKKKTSEFVWFNASEKAPEESLF